MAIGIPVNAAINALRAFMGNWPLYLKYKKNPIGGAIFEAANQNLDKLSLLLLFSILIIFMLVNFFVQPISQIPYGPRFFQCNWERS